MRVTPIHRAIFQIAVPFEGGGTVFLYVLKADGIALVDTGTSQSPREAIVPALGEIGIRMSDVDLILNTHTHLDHSGGNLESKRLSNAPVYAHVSDTAWANSTEAQVEAMTAPLRALEFPPDLISRRSEYIARTTGTPVGIDMALSDGDSVDLGAGIQLRAFHSPGHTPGCVCYYYEREGILITGDSVQAHGSRPGGYPSYLNAGDYRRSLDRLSQLDCRLLCMGHAFLGGGLLNDPVQSGHDARTFLQSSIQAADTIHRAVSRAVREMPDATRRETVLRALQELIFHIPQRLVPETGMPSYAGPTLLSHIEAAVEGKYPVEL